VTEVPIPAPAPEFWRIRPDEALPAPAELRAHPERRETLATVLNLDALADGVFLDPEKPLLYYAKRLEGHQAEAWSSWFDTTYSRYLEEWQFFDGETPTEVMEELNVALQLGVFDDLEIWTRDEGDDFVAVGIVYLDVEDDEVGLVPIARWGRDRTQDSRILAEYEAKDGTPGRGRTVQPSDPEREHAVSERRKNLLQLTVLILLVGVLIWLFAS
jgi:hypothetical protein